MPQAPEPNTDHEWQLESAVARARELVGEYVSLTRRLMRELGNAQDAIAAAENSEATAGFADFCQRIGIAPETAERWVQKSRTPAEQPAAAARPVLQLAACDSRQIADLLAEPLRNALLRQLRIANQELLTLSEAADFLRSPQSYLDELVAARRIPAYEIGDCRFLLRSDLLAFVRLHPATSLPPPTAAVAASQSIFKPSSAPTSNPDRATTDNSQVSLPSSSSPSVNPGIRSEKGGRGTWRSAQEKLRIKEQIVQEVRTGAGIMRAIKNAGISWSTLTAWRKDDPAFADRLRLLDEPREIGGS